MKLAAAQRPVAGASPPLHEAHGVPPGWTVEAGAMLSSPGLAVNQHFAAVLDGKLLSVICVNHHVYSFGIPADEATDIAGGFTPVTADRLAKQIAAEPLPADLQLIRATTVSRRVPPGSDLPGGGTTAPRRPAGPA